MCIENILKINVYKTIYSQNINIKSYLHVWITARLYLNTIYICNGDLKLYVIVDDID